MADIHASLSPATNIVLIIVWGCIAATLYFIVVPHVPLAVVLVGAALGAAGGAMQHLSLKDATIGLTSASSLLDVRRVLKSTAWGSRYISWLYFSTALLAILAFLLVRHPWLGVGLTYLAGYTSLAFARELVTLRDTFFLQRLVSQPISDSTYRLN